MPRFSVPVRCTFVVYHDVIAEDEATAKKMVEKRLEYEHGPVERSVASDLPVSELPSPEPKLT
jgi:hypothetical protein